MSYKIATEDRALLTKTIGDPFADAGGYVINFLWQQPHLKNKNILELIEYVAKIYVKNWRGKLNSFFLNSTITQPAFKGDRKIEETLRYFRSLLDETAHAAEGYCRISGRRAKLYPAGRDNHILSGSGTFINFHHSFDSGILVAKEVLIRMFFVPFGTMQLSDKIALIHSSNDKVTQFFIDQNCETNLQRLAGGIAEGILKSPFNSPSNALFQFIDNCLVGLKPLLYSRNDEVNEMNAPSLTLYHFTNFGANPDVTIYNLSSEVFKFYAHGYSIKYQSLWKKFIRAHYKNSKYKDAVFDETGEVWRSRQDIQYDVYRTWRNEILERLLIGVSILPQIARWSFDHEFPFGLVEIYQTYIRKMEKRTLEKIKEIADFIVDHKEADYIEKCINRLNKEKSINGLRLFMLRLTEENYERDGQAPLINLQDYSEYLFPDGINWREIRDVLLIAIYERLHALKLKIAAELIDDENETITPN
jgi:CRISPR-associated protein Cst1